MAVPARPISFYFRSLEGTGSPLAEARLLAELDRTYREVAPRALRHLSGIVSYRDGTIKIRATSGAAAAKLRHMSPRLIQALRERGFEVTSIQALVQASQPSPPGPGTPLRRLSPKAVESLEALAGRLPPSPLRAALRALITRGGRRAR